MIERSEGASDDEEGTSYFGKATDGRTDGRTEGGTDWVGGGNHAKKCRTRRKERESQDRPDLITFGAYLPTVSQSHLVPRGE